VPLSCQRPNGAQAHLDLWAERAAAQCPLGARDEVVDAAGEPEGPRCRGLDAADHSAVINVSEHPVRHGDRLRGPLDLAEHCQTAQVHLEPLRLAPRHRARGRQREFAGVVAADGHQLFGDLDQDGGAVPVAGRRRGQGMGRGDVGFSNCRQVVLREPTMQVADPVLGNGCVYGLADEVVMESERVVVGDEQDTSLDRRRETLHRLLAHQAHGVAQRERPARRSDGLGQFPGRGGQGVDLEGDGRGETGRDRRALAARRGPGQIVDDPAGAQRIALDGGQEGPGPLVGFVAEPVLRQRQDVGLVQGSQTQPLDPDRLVPDPLPLVLAGAARHDPDDRQPGEPGNQGPGDEGADPVGPLEVVQRDHDRPFPRDTVQVLRECLGEDERLVDHTGEPVVLVAAHHLVPPAAQHGQDRRAGPDLFHRVAFAAQHGQPQRGGLVAQGREQGRLADSRRPGHQDRTTGPVSRGATHNGERSGHGLAATPQRSRLQICHLSGVPLYVTLPIDAGGEEVRIFAGEVRGIQPTCGRRDQSSDATRRSMARTSASRPRATAVDSSS
jgi:hypothetical protein